MTYNNPYPLIIPLHSASGTNCGGAAQPCPLILPLHSASRTWCGSALTLALSLFLLTPAFTRCGGALTLAYVEAINEEGWEVMLATSASKSIDSASGSAGTEEEVPRDARPPSTEKKI